MTDTQLRVAAAQMRSGMEPGANLDTIAAFAAEAKREGADYLLTPEMSVAFARDRAQLAGIAEPYGGNSALKRCSAIARETGLFLHIGSLAIAHEDGRFTNRSCLFGPDGALKAFYDKIHLFDADPQGDKGYRESATYSGGEHMVMVEADGIRVGMSICYDVRFPQLYADLALGGSQLITIPSAFTVPTGRAHWEVLVRARAIETGCFVVAAAQGGTHENGRQTWGHSMIVDPWGGIVAEKADDEPGLIHASLDLDAVADARAQVPALANRRPYSLSVNHEAPEWAPKGIAK